MRVLTVRQPWAWAIIHGGKDVENRTRNLAGSYRGPVAIHAGLTIDPAGEDDARIWAAVEASETPVAGLHTGVILGVVDLVGVHEGIPASGDEPACCESPWGERPVVEVKRLCDPVATSVSTNVRLVLANPRPVRWPIGVRGRLGLWTPDEALRDEIQEAIA